MAGSWDLGYLHFAGLEVASPSVHDSINSADLTQDPHMAGDNYGVRHLAIDSSSLLAFGDLPPSTGTGLTFLEETYDISDCSKCALTILFYTKHSSCVCNMA